jgi:microcystin-dependent protein
MNNNIIYIIIVFVIIYFIFNNNKNNNNNIEKFTQLTGFNNIVLSNEIGDLQSIQFPPRIIVLWSGDISQIPEGWTICDGTTKNGIITPDLRGKFVLGVNPESTNPEFRVTNKSGGSNKISKNQVPAHTHSYNDVYFVENEDFVKRNVGNTYIKIEGANNMWGLGTNMDWDNSAMGKTRETSSIGNGEDYYPPYYILAYIMRI